MAVALAMALRRALPAFSDPASVDDHIVVVGVTVDPDGAEGEAVNLHCRPPGQSLLALLARRHCDPDMRLSARSAKRVCLIGPSVDEALPRQQD
jgi:hypothetical protein